jgi:hypothetical protein
MTITPEKIIDIVSDYYHVPVDKVLSISRKIEYVKARHVSMYFIRNKFKHLSLSAIGEFFIGKEKPKDHASILHAIKKVNNYMDVDHFYKTQIKALDLYISKGVIDNPVVRHITNESDLLNENTELKAEIIKLKEEINSLCTDICILKEKKNKVIEIMVPVKAEPEVKEIVIRESPYKHISPRTKEYHGYIEHSF